MERGGDQRTKDDISKCGCSVMHVFDAPIFLAVRKVNA
jgi:hypothetical protein